LADVGRFRGRAREEYLRNRVGWVFSSAGLQPLMRALENVWLADLAPASAHP
jgi:predicted ABC-type transport system involved in lysophospholipase L1 biosynthesis ATPase subunit